MRVSTTVAVIGIVIAACGEADLGAPEISTTTADETTISIEATTSTAAAPTATTDPNTTIVAETTTTAGASPNANTVLRGEPVDMGPSAGDVLGVIGVGHDDFLNLRAGPGADQPIVGRIPATYDSLIARGETRSLPAFWTKVVYRGTEGWVNMSYLAFSGSVDDITARVIEDFGERPEASTMAELGRMIAEWAASNDPPSTIVMVVDEKGGDLGEVTFDVVGLGDDAVRGVRLHVFAENLEGHFQLRTVEQTSFCDPARGVDEGFCV